MEFKTTRKAIVNGSAFIVSAGYCSLSHLLAYRSRSAYTCGVYGWNFDAYDLDGLTVCTGYRNMPGETAVLISRYESLANAIRSDYKISYEAQKEAIEALLRKWVQINLDTLAAKKHLAEICKVAGNREKAIVKDFSHAEKVQEDNSHIVYRYTDKAGKSFCYDLITKAICG